MYHTFVIPVGYWGFSLYLCEAAFLEFQYPCQELRSLFNKTKAGTYTGTGTYIFNSTRF